MKKLIDEIKCLWIPIERTLVHLSFLFRASEVGLYRCPEV